MGEKFFKNKTVVISGATRGIGKAIGLKLASEGAKVAILAKSVVEDPRLGGTIYTAADEMDKAGGKGLGVQCDIRDEENIKSAIETVVKEFGGIDILINNASAISLTNTEKTESKKYDLMHGINVRGTFLMSKYCIPYLKNGINPHILNLSPPLSMNMKWFGQHIAYTTSKYSMTMIALGLAEELRPFSIAANSLWPKTTIATAAVKNLLGGDALINMSRTPEIVADAAHWILSQPSNYCTGNTFIDEEIFKINGNVDLEKYSVVKGAKLFNDLFIDG